MGCVQTLKTLIQEDPYLIQKALIYTSSINTIETPLLHVSVSHGHLEFTRLLLDHNPQLAAEVDAFQRTPLHLACENGDMEMVGALLEKNTSACLVEDHNGFIPLHYAVMSGKIEMMKLLIEARPQSVLMKLSNNGKTLLHLCVEGNHLEGMKLLTAQTLLFDKHFLNTLDDAGHTILDLSLMLRRIEMVGYLLRIPEVKTRTTSMRSIASSNYNPNESRESRIKMRNTRNLKRKRQESISLYTKKTTGRLWKVWRKKLKYKGDWVEEVQGTMMLVATVIATVTFQAGVDPPGGVWQENTEFNCWSFKNNNMGFGLDLYYCDSLLSNNTIIFPAGTAIMSYQQAEPYWIYVWMNTISFLASMSVILMIVSRFPLKNRICSWLFALAMCIAVVSLVVGYLLGVKMVNLLSFRDYLKINDSYNKVFPLTIMCWLGVVGMVGLWQVAHFLKSLFHIFTSKLKSHNFKVNSARFFQSTA